jgi:hypothetical protein
MSTFKLFPDVLNIGLGGISKDRILFEHANFSKPCYMMLS